MKNTMQDWFYAILTLPVRPTTKGAAQRQWDDKAAVLIKQHNPNLTENSFRVRRSHVRTLRHPLVQENMAAVVHYAVTTAHKTNFFKQAIEIATMIKHSEPFPTFRRQT